MQYDNLQGPSDFQHLLTTQGFWLPLICAAVLLGCYLRGSIGALNFWIYFVPATVIGVIAWVHGRQIRRELAKIREGSIADANAVYLKPTPWAKLSLDFLLRPTQEGNYRLRMENTTLWLTQYPIDAEIQCTADQAAELGNWLRLKIKAAKPPDPRIAEAIYQWKQRQGSTPK